VYPVASIKLHNCFILIIMFIYEYNILNQSIISQSVDVRAEAVRIEATEARDCVDLHRAIRCASIRKKDTLNLSLYFSLAINQLALEPINEFAKDFRFSEEITTFVNYLYVTGFE